MRISVLKSGRKYHLDLPQKVYGNYWLTDFDAEGNERKLIQIEAEADRWRMVENRNTKILLNTEVVPAIFLEKYQFYTIVLSEETEERILLYCEPIYEEEMNRFVIPSDMELKIGKNNDNQIRLEKSYFPIYFFRLRREKGIWFFSAVDQTYRVYINDVAYLQKKLEYGDVIFALGLKIIVMKDFIIINDLESAVQWDTSLFDTPYENAPLKLEESDSEVLKEEKLYNEDDYFFQAPRFRTAIEPLEMKIDSPPAKEQSPSMPIIYTIGPMLTMGMSSLVMSMTSVNSMLSQGRSFKDTLPTLIMALAMVATMVLWPTLTKRFEAKQRVKKEAARQKKYSEYIDSKRLIVSNAVKSQKQILKENYISSVACKEIISERRAILWERKIEQDDFLVLRLGLGTIPLDANIQYPQEGFSMEEDNLKAEVAKLANDAKDLIDVPVVQSFVEKNIAAIIGTKQIRSAFINQLILQMMTFHSYTDLKIVVMTDDESSWDFLKVLPHCWDNNRSIRFFATCPDEYKELSFYLEKDFYHRKYDENGAPRKENFDYKDFAPYYVVITDNFSKVRNVEIVKDILEQDVNLGFSFIVLNERLFHLPDECTNFINVTETTSGVFESELISTKQQEFVADLLVNDDLYPYCYALANIPLQLDKTDGESKLPISLGFLEMYNVGDIEQLNCQNRWVTNNPMISLQVPVGVDENGEVIKLDLHEKFHGPHGLIAGMTGSGKSEFILTYILSLAINFHPDEVAFILIDYKGGGLAGAFENKESGIRLPHLVGTITNLDKAELNRSLASIQSELRRRQSVFNEVRDRLNAGTIDIYKYQKLYREGKVTEPIPHLFIISDEFAELKAQQPDFMTQLVSTARIGRSLGVHLILATQKPSGVVDDQIWSNSKFKVCLKVQEKADSQDMIKRPDAAFLKNIGRFYLQVGYNEYFVLGQSAWSGAQYIPMDKPQKVVDNAIDVINHIGTIVNSFDDTKKVVTKSTLGEQLTNIVKYLSDLSQELQITPKDLWLPSIAPEIYVADLKVKYQYQTTPRNIEPIIGEYDDPANQRQGLLTLPLSKEGNAIIYGSTGTGKENLLNTLIYSSILEYTPDNLNFYILDFGSETLRNYQKAPQVGDILFSNDKEKIGNLFKMLREEIEYRKKCCADYNGDIDYYVESTKQVLPIIVVLINNFEAFFESYEMFEDELLYLTREGSRYKLIFVITSTGPTTIRYRIKQNFKQEVILQFHDDMDYAAVIGKTEGVYPSKVLGRGLIKLDGIYEFQTAYAYLPNKMSEYIKQVATLLREKYPNQIARRVPVLPDEVNPEFLEDKTLELNRMPVGVVENDLSIAYADLTRKTGYLVTAYDCSSLIPFARGFIQLFLRMNHIDLIVLDAEELLKEHFEAHQTYYRTDFQEVIQSLKEDVNRVTEDPSLLVNHRKEVYFVIGIERFLKRLGNDGKVVFEDIMKKGRDAEYFTFVLTDMVDSFKKVEYDEWYKVATDSSNGIWIGSGITDQFTLKLNRTSRELMESLNDNFGYLVSRGIPTRMKLLQYNKIDGEEDA